MLWLRAWGYRHKRYKILKMECFRIFECPFAFSRWLYLNCLNMMKTHSQVFNMFGMNTINRFVLVYLACWAWDCERDAYTNVFLMMCFKERRQCCEWEHAPNSPRQKGPCKNLKQVMITLVYWNMEIWWSSGWGSSLKMSDILRENEHNSLTGYL